MNMSRGVFVPICLAWAILSAALQAGVDTAWVRRYDGPAHGDDWATRIAVDSAGNVYVTGTSSSDTSSSAQYLDFVTIKYYPNGDTAWVRRADFGGKDIPYGLAVDQQGNVYAAGTNNDSRMVTVKYSPTGLRLWYGFFGSQGGASDLALDSQENVLVCGSSFLSSLDAATVKYRPNGDTAWARFFDWAGDEDYALALAVGQMGDVAVTGYGARTGTHYDCLTAKHDSSGGRLWVVGYDGPNHGDDRTSDASAGGSECVVTGYGDNGYTTPYDYLTIKYDSAGETLWTRRYDGPASSRDQAVAVALDSGGGVFVTGFSRGQNTIDDYATVKYDSNGTQLWVARYDGPGSSYDHAYAIAVDRQGNAYVTGEAGAYCATVKYSPSGESLWCALYNGLGNWSIGRATTASIDGTVDVTGQSDGVGTGSDFVTIKYEQNGGVEEYVAPAAPHLTVHVMPNPFVTQTMIRFGHTADGPAVVEVYDVSGRRVKTLYHGLKVPGWHCVVWNATNDVGSRVPSGIYTIVVRASDVSSRIEVAVLD